MGHRTERAEQAVSQRQLPPHKYTGDLHSLQGATVFSSLDCGAYHTERIEPGSQACTAFISPFGTFQYIRMPFGLAKVGSV